MTTNTDLHKRRMAALPRGLATAMPVFVSKASNAEVWDVEGNRFIDFAAGIAVLNVGHQHPKVMSAVSAQMQRFGHLAFQVAGYDHYVEVCERLNQMAPVSGTAKSILFSTGAEAVENAIKIARRATGRRAVIAFGGGFHGRSFMAMALTGKTAPYKQGFGPLPGGVFHVPFPSEHKGITEEESLRALEQVFAVDVEASDVAAIIFEPVQGEGGFNPAPASFLMALRRIADKHGIVLIADEVQTGFARTGRMFAVEHSDVRPDMITMAKALAGGYPLSAVVGRQELMDSVDPGGLGSTYAGAPVACAAALAVFDIIENDGLVDRALKIGLEVRARLEELARRDDLRPIGNIRGKGSMLAFDLLESRNSSKGDPAATRAVLQRAHSLGLILLSCGAEGEAIRLLYPLTIDDKTLDEALEILAQALAAGV